MKKKINKKRAIKALFIYVMKFDAFKIKVD